MAGGLLARERELALVHAFLDEAGAGAAALVLEGEPGIGKTTVWRAAIEHARARGLAVLHSRPLELDMRIPFAGLRDLFADRLDVVLPALPAPQRRALETALRLSDPGDRPPEPAAIAFAFLGGLEALARQAPVVVAVDDAQWLDEPTASVVRFASRRLGDAPVRLLLTRRAGVDGAELGLERSLEPDRLSFIALGPLSVGAIRRLLVDQLAAPLPRPLLMKVYATSGGNPFYALELVRALKRPGRPLAPGEPLPVPETLGALVEARLTGLPPGTVRALEVAALLIEPTVASVAAGADGAGLSPAVAAGVVELEGDRVRFAHPLLASVIVARVEPGRRRRLHRRLARVEADPENRARHLALAATGEDEEAARALDEAGRIARARGASDVAAELLERAVLLTPVADAGSRARRLLRAAEAASDAGDWGRARTLAEDAAALLRRGPLRAQALRIVGETNSNAEVLERALEEAAGDPALRAGISTALANVYVGKDFRASLRAGRAAVADAELAGDAGLLAQGLSMVAWFEGACCAGDPEATAARAAELERPTLDETRGLFTSTFTLATVWMWHDDHVRARAGFEALREHDERRGDAWGQAHALFNLAQVEWRAGDWGLAARLAAEAPELWPTDDPASEAALRWIGAVVAAHRGDLDEARGVAEQGFVAADPERNLLFRGRNAWILGACAFWAGDVDEAAQRLEEAQRLFDTVGAVEPGMRLFAGDLLDAYLAAGMVDRAEALSESLVHSGRELSRPRATVIGLRGRGMVLAARGDPDPALGAVGEAAAEATSWPVPLEQGRTLLALGQLQRRARRRREARETLQRAAGIFERLGAQLLAARARAELARIGGRAPATGALTPTERRIAELVARGLTNREVAAELVLAVHTVETALTRIYAKVGVRSRTELARRFALDRDAN